MKVKLSKFLSFILIIVIVITMGLNINLSSNENLISLGYSANAVVNGVDADGNNTFTFNYTGAVEMITLSGNVRIECWGAQGGGTYGGKGGYTKGEITLPPNTKLYITVGECLNQRGGQAGSRTTFGGGGAGGGNNGFPGGGASDVRMNSVTLSDRIIVAGGGGGASGGNGDYAGSKSSETGGVGGGLVGGNGDNNTYIITNAGKGGTQADINNGGAPDGTKGTLGQGGKGGNGAYYTADYCYPWPGGGGGGGFYGGGGGSGCSSSLRGAGGGGGSSYISTNAINTVMQQGVNPGNGLVKITCLNSLPLINSTNLFSGTFSEIDNAFKPTIDVIDSNNDILTCKYYIDSEATARDTVTVSDAVTAKLVTFNNGVDFSTLQEGSHTLRFEINDGHHPISQTFNIKVDKSAPILSPITTNSSYNNISLSGSASDSISGLDPFPYRYTIESTPTSWLTSNSNTWNSNLIPNTQYSVKFEARDAKGHIAYSTQSIYTKAQQPILTVNNPSSYTLDLSTSDINPANTQFQISVNNGVSYLTSEGRLNSGSTWMTFPAGKKITLSGLTPNTTYNFTIKAKNAENVETVTSSASGTTLVAPPGSPTNIVATANNNLITVSWDPVTNATGYDLEADGVVKDAGNNTSYTVTGLTQNTQHTYRVRSKGAGGPGEWSAPITKSTLPNAPGVPINIITAPASTSITVVWDSVGGATGYDIEVDGDIVNNGPTTNYTHRGLASGTHHTYRVRSINPGGKSEWSQIVNASTTVETPTVPANLKAIPAHTEIVLSWDAIAGATYDIEVDGTVIDTGTRTSYTHAGLTTGTEHIYRVRSKKNGSTGEWSAALKVSTLPNEFGTPANIQTTAADTSITITWDAVSGATGYEVEADGLVIDNGASNTCIHNSLEPGTQHSYRVRAKNGTQVSDWSQIVNITTTNLPAPSNMTAEATENSITVKWNAVTGAALYDLEMDGTVTENLSTAQFTCTSLLPNTQHIFRVRAKNGTGGVSAWTIPLVKATVFSGANIPSKITAMSASTSITILWSDVLGAAGYDIEVDGTVMADIPGASYKHIGLTAGTQHTYRVRAKSPNGTGGWSKLITVSSLSQGPAIPANLIASASTTTILLSWDAAENAASYEIEVDGVIISAGQSTSYLHTGLSPNSQHKYRVRSKNAGGTSAWSSLTTFSTKSSTATFTLDCSTGEIFNLQFNANEMSQPNGVTYTITYDKTKLDVLDLCSTTAKADLAVENIPGSDIKIVQFVPGTITFIKTGAVSPGETWTGFVNSIKFKSNIDGQITITYSIN